MRVSLRRPALSAAVAAGLAVSLAPSAVAATAPTPVPAAGTVPSHQLVAHPPVDGGLCANEMGRFDDRRPPLQKQKDGVVLLSAVATTEPVRANPGYPGSVWVHDPLPEPDTRPVVIFYSPHPDDETLSAGVLLADAAHRGYRVIVVALTDGRDTGVLPRINGQLQLTWLRDHEGSLDGFEPLSQADIGAARLDEFRRAAGALGVDPADVYAAHLDDPSSDCGGIVSVHEADQVERAFAAQFPHARHVTMSYDAERQQDHLAAGLALRHLVDAQVVTDAQWVVSRLWWTLPSPYWQWQRPVSAAVNDRVQAAVYQYLIWNPSMAEYAVGGFSVRTQLRAMQIDARNRVHGMGPTTEGYTSTRTTWVERPAP